MTLFKPLLPIPHKILIISAAALLVSAFIIPLKQNEEIRLGLLIPDIRSQAASRGAEMAIRKANREGGLNGRPFRLVVRSMEGPWGTGSKEAVSLVFDEKVWAMLGSHDGRNAHLVEQVSAKTRVVFLSAWSGDPTLAQAFIPWFFNCVPDDREQASALAEEIYARKNFSRVAVISDKSYDSNSFLTCFLKEAGNRRKAEPLIFTFNGIAGDPRQLSDSVSNSHADCILLLGRPSTALKLLQLPDDRKIRIPVFGPVQLLDENELPERDLQKYNGLTVISNVNPGDQRYLSFRKEFTESWSQPPGPVASYAYDGMMMIINAIRESGKSDYTRIKESLLRTDYHGVTGYIRFDSMGNRKGTCNLAEIKNGTLVPFKQGPQ